MPARSSTSPSWTERNGVYLKRHAVATKRLEELDEERRQRVGKSKTIKVFIKGLRKQSQAITEFEESVWVAVIKCVIVQVDGWLTFRFKNGGEIDV